MIQDRGLYRPNVGIMIVNPDNLVFWARRTGTDIWQCPQGGVDKGETPRQALRRELLEETGLEIEGLEILASTRGWVKYVIPERLRRGGRHVGQRQKWFLLRFDGPDDAVDLGSCGGKPEFDAWRWEDPSLIERQVVGFKRASYARALREFLPLIGGPG